MAITTTEFDAALKEYYSPRTIENLCYESNPFFAMVKKDENFYGDVKPVPVIYGMPQGIGADFTKAQAQAAVTTGLYGKFNLTRASLHGVVDIGNEVLEASENDKGAFIKARTSEIDLVMQGVTRRLSVAMYRKGWGSIGRAHAGGATTTLTLGDGTDLHPSSITNFEKGQKLVFSSSEDGATLNSATPLTVTAVNRAAGTLTVSANLSTVSVAAGDYIFIEGDRQDSATPERQVIAGIEDWLPYGGPSATAFFGLVRTTDATRLGGQWLDGSTMAIDQAIYKGAVRCAREGGKPDVCFTNFENYGNLISLLGSNRQYVETKIADVGFEGVKINGPAGPIKVIPDQNCPGDRAFVLTMKTWEYSSLKKAIRFNATDGNEILRSGTSDAVQARVVSRGQLSCEAPGWNCNVKLAHSAA